MPIPGIEQPQILPIDNTLRLRRFDDNFLFALDWYQDPQTVYLVDGVKTPYTTEKLERMYHYLDKQGELYFIELRTIGGWQPIGDVTFWQADMPIVIGDPACRGKGIGRRVITALADRARDLGYSEIYVNEIYDYNTGSRKCFEHAGFRVCAQQDGSVRLVLKL